MIVREDCGKEMIRHCVGKNIDSILEGREAPPPLSIFYGRTS